MSRTKGAKDKTPRTRKSGYKKKVEQDPHSTKILMTPEQWNKQQRKLANENKYNMGKRKANQPPTKKEALFDLIASDIKAQYARRAEVLKQYTDLREKIIKERGPNTNTSYIDEEIEKFFKGKQAQAFNENQARMQEMLRAIKLSKGQSITSGSYRLLFEMFAPAGQYNKSQRFGKIILTQVMKDKRFVERGDKQHGNIYHFNQVNYILEGHTPDEIYQAWLQMNNGSDDTFYEDWIKNGEATLQEVLEYMRTMNNSKDENVANAMKGIEDDE